MAIRFINAQIFQPQGFVTGELYVSDGKIAAPCAVEKTYDCQGFFLIPGLIDLQVNGIAGHDFTTSLKTLPEACLALAESGVTSFLATIISQPLRRYKELLHDFERHKSTCLGLHLEGPHLNHKKRGAHPLNAIMEECAVEFWKETLNDSIKMVTVAPECLHAMEFIELLTSKNIVVACGHTEAGLDDIHRAKLHGATFATHLFNAMQAFHQRSPGIIGYVLGQRSLWYSLIVDGVHLHPDTIAMAYNAFSEGLVLVSDSSARTLAGHALDIQDKKKVIAGTETLAGSNCTLLDSVNMLHKLTSCSFHYAVDCATRKPAKLLGLPFKGELLEGYDADLVILDETGSCCRTFIAGKQVFP